MTSDFQIDLNEVNRRLDNCSDAVADQYYAFGLMMIDEINARWEYLDAKASKAAGYCGAIVALLLSTSATWKQLVDPCMVPVVLTAAIISLYAAYTFFSATLLADAQWFSTRDWFCADYLNQPKELKKYWIQVMYFVRQSYLEQVNLKATKFFRGWLVLAFASGMLIVALLDGACRSSPLFHRFSLWLWT